MRRRDPSDRPPVARSWAGWPTRAARERAELRVDNLRTWSVRSRQWDFADADEPGRLGDESRAVIFRAAAGAAVGPPQNQ